MPVGVLCSLWSVMEAAFGIRKLFHRGGGRWLAFGVAWLCRRSCTIFTVRRFISLSPDVVTAAALVAVVVVPFAADGLIEI
jgi:hypothetical protein